MKKKPISERMRFVPPAKIVVQQAGYIVWKDSKVTIFYSNDLKFMPSSPILEGADLEAVECVHGLAELECWTGSENLHCTKFNVPTTIVAYNIFMNSVDCMDQRQSTNPTRQVEKRLHMSFFMLFLDLALHYAYAVFQKIDSQNADCTAYREFKRIIAERLVSLLVAEAGEKSTPKTSPAVANRVFGSTTGE
jgi:hypothetical protein